ncbi:MAG: hypothetical protein JHC84_08775 [Solirubrobacteraceae bacterium]|nr:hypothetical protein [Solirubrobacteraceae bacterium]
MWRKTDLLHPATVIASIALFVALGGVTYAAATIGTSQLKNGAVTRAKIKNRAVSPSKLANRAVTNEKLATNAVTPAKLRARAVTVGKIADNAVQSPNLTTGAVTESKLGSGAVTPSKLGAGAVGTAALADGAVTAGKIADGTIPASKLQTGQVVTGRGALTSFHTDLTNGQTATVATLAGFGTISTTCTNGNADSQFTNQSGVAVDARRLSTSNTQPNTVAVSAVGTGASVTVTNAVGNQVVTWQLGYTDAAGVQHVATVEVTNVLDGTACTVMGQAQAS